MPRVCPIKLIFYEWNWRAEKLMGILFQKSEATALAYSEAPRYPALRC